MKKLGKKRTTQSETVQAYACVCTLCPCASCATSAVSEVLVSGETGTTRGTLMLLG